MKASTGWSRPSRLRATIRTRRWCLPEALVDLANPQNAETVTARYIFTELGLAPGRFTLEPRARNTYENILFSQELMKPKPGQVWLLDTAAIHMPRAIAVARKLGWPMIAWPSDYITRLAARVSTCSMSAAISA